MIIAYIDRTKASDMSIETGPLTATLQIDAAAKKAGYATRDGTLVGLYLYRVGHSVDGKDWREAGLSRAMKQASPSTGRASFSRERRSGRSASK